MGNCLQQVSNFFNIFGACEFSLGRESTMEHGEIQDERESIRIEKLNMKNNNINKDF